MHRSGITVTKELQDELLGVQRDEAKCGAVVQIRDEAFVLVETLSGSGSGGLGASFEALAGALKEGEAAYGFAKGGGEDGSKWVLVNFVPSNAVVRHKMLYASSRGALKDGVGAQAFAPDLYVSELKEVTLAEYEASQREHDDEDLMTAEEIDKREAHSSSQREAVAPRALAIADVPLRPNQGVIDLLKAYGEGANDAVALYVDSAKEELSGTEAKADAEEISALFKPAEPMYALYRYKHTHDGAKSEPSVFVYYCPDNAKPREKMMSATFRSMVLRIIEETAGVADTVNVEASAQSDLTTKIINDQIHPPEVVDKSFKKPTRSGQGRRRMHGKAKFSAAK